ncbi:MAG: DUF3575 domain-containing protein [Rikenellaceae bacterium]
MKRILLLLLVFPLVSFASPQGQGTQSKKEQNLLTSLYYEFNDVYASNEELAKLNNVIKLLVGDPTIIVKIEGYGDPVGGKEVNDRVSLARASRIASYLIRHMVSESQITYEGCGIDSSAKSDALARRVDISQVITVAIKPISKKDKPIDSSATKPTDKPKTTEETAEKRPVADIPEETTPDVTTANSKDGFSLRTNLLYWCVGNINLGVEYTKNSFGYLINGGYSPFAKTEWNYNLGSWFVAPEIRYYLGVKEAWFVGAQFIAGGYNYKLSDTGYKGSTIGGGVTGGYKLNISEKLDMDFSLGLGYGTRKYDTYYKHENGTNVYVDKDVTKNTFMPIQLGVSLIFKL